MINLKKILLSLVVFSVVLICSVFSVSAEDVNTYIYNDPDFEPFVSPSYSGPEQDGVVYFDVSLSDDDIAFIVHDLTDDIYFLVYGEYDPVGLLSDNFSFYLVSGKTRTNSSLYYLTVALQTLDTSATSWSRFSPSVNSQKVYTQSGTQSSSAISKPWYKYDNFSALAYYELNNSHTYEVWPVNTQFFGLSGSIEYIENGLNMSNRYVYGGGNNAPSNYWLSVSPASNITFSPIPYCIPNSLGIGSYWTYTPDYGSGTAYVISGSSSGTIIDENGNTYNTYNEYSFEMPDREFDDSISEPERPTVPNSDINTIDFDITDFDAFSWVSDRLQELAYTNNAKIRLMFLSILSLGVIMVILNKRI